MLANVTVGICSNLRKAGRRAHEARGNGVLQKGKLLPLSAAVTGAASYQCATDGLSIGHVQLVVVDRGKFPGVCKLLLLWKVELGGDTHMSLASCI